MTGSQIVTCVWLVIHYLYSFLRRSFNGGESRHSISVNLIFASNIDETLRARDNLSLKIHDHCNQLLEILLVNDACFLNESQAPVKNQDVGGARAQARTGVSVAGRAGGRGGSVGFHDDTLLEPDQAVAVRMMPAVRALVWKAL